MLNGKKNNFVFKLISGFSYVCLCSNCCAMNGDAYREYTAVEREQYDSLIADVSDVIAESDRLANGGTNPNVDLLSRGLSSLQELYSKQKSYIEQAAFGNIGDIDLGVSCDVSNTAAFYICNVVDRLAEAAQ
jgi:hypothetical protein